MVETKMSSLSCISSLNISNKNWQCSHGPGFSNEPTVSPLHLPTANRTFEGNHWRQPATGLRLEWYQRESNDIKDKLSTKRMDNGTVYSYLAKVRSRRWTDLSKIGRFVLHKGENALCNPQESTINTLAQARNNGFSNRRVW